MVPPDTCNRVGVLTRREIEARLLAPLIDAFAEKMDRAEVIAIVTETITRIARNQGAAMAEQHGGASMAGFADSLSAWTKDDALRIEIHEQTDEVFSFDVTRCRYAELYRSLGIPELGAAFSCNRDAALIEGYTSDIVLTRTQTIMQGAPCCDFRYRRRSTTP
jgi:predicted ArsR family transcriptional regulator